MRLSAFNKGKLHNVVYILSDQPMKIKSIPEEYVVRQIPGSQLYSNVTQPLPLRVVGGTINQIPDWQKKTLPARRNPEPKNGAAKDLFAGDLLTVQTGELSHLHEENEKMLLMIGERLSLRGPEIDKLNEQSLKKERDAIVEKALADLKQEMTLTVVDGNFPREVIASRNLALLQLQNARPPQFATILQRRAERSGHEAGRQSVPSESLLLRRTAGNPVSRSEIQTLCPHLGDAVLPVAGSLRDCPLAETTPGLSVSETRIVGNRLAV